MLRKIIATWAVLQFLVVGGWAGLATFRAQMAQSDWSINPLNLSVSAIMAVAWGMMAAILSMALPAFVAAMGFWIWKLFSDEGGKSPAMSNITLGDIAGIASALHPRTGALLNVAANIDARTQALNVTAPAAPAHNPVDDERL